MLCVPQPHGIPAIAELDDRARESLHHPPSQAATRATPSTRRAPAALVEQVAKELRAAVEGYG